MYKIPKKLSLALLVAMLCQIFIFVPINAEEIYGDLNNDGTVNSADYTYMRRYLLGIISEFPSNTNVTYADTYKDGKIDSADCMILRKFLLRQIKTLPVIPIITPTTTPIPTTTPTEDWISFVPQPENVGLNLVIDYSSHDSSNPQKYIQANITFPNGGYRIADEGKLEYSILKTNPTHVNYTTSGVKIEKYIGSNPVTQALMTKVIKYPIGNEQGATNYFDFKVGDKSVTEFYFTKDSLISPTPVPYSGTINKDFVNGNTQFAANLLQKFNVEDAKKNVFFSPLSISMALSMVYQGADTTTKEEMAKTLNYSGMNTEDVNQSYIDHLKYFKSLYPQIELNIGNSIWIRNGFDVKDSFMTKNKEVFDAQCSYIDFSATDAADILNNWISNATKGKITNMIQPPISDETMMYLMNAIYFKGNWTDQFSESETQSGYFTNINGEKKPAMMMNKYYNYNYTENTDYRAVELPYGSGNVSMYCILPETENVNDFITTFDSNKWTEIKSNLNRSEKIQLKLPRFKIEYKPEKLTDNLKELGMIEAFTKNADFSGISGNLWIDNVIHKAVIDVNEKGTEAAAVTIIGMNGTAMPNTFIADKPFMFVIADNETGTILFIGKVVDL